VGAVVELGERVGLTMSVTKTVYACTKLLAECAVSQPAK
jgi:ketopantoate reductase